MSKLHRAGPETLVMQQKEPEQNSPIGPLDWRRILPFEADATSDSQGWVGIEAARFRAEPAFELNLPPLTHHWLVLVARPPEELDMMYDGVKRHTPPPAGSIMLVPAGSPVRVRSSGCKDQLHIYLDPRLVERIAAEEFELDSGRLTIPSLGGVDLPHLSAVMCAVGAELSTSGAGGPLAAESLANVLAVQVIRQILAPRQPEPREHSALPRARLRGVLAYIEEHIDTGLTLNQMATAAHLSVYHFARQFKTATGVPPHQYVIARRVERARQLLQPDLESSLAEIAASAGFSDQSQFSYHFKRLVGVTPGQFRKNRIKNRKLLQDPDPPATYNLCPGTY